MLKLSQQIVPMLLRVAVLLCLIAATAFAQQVDRARIESEDQLAYALLATSNNPTSNIALLQSNQRLVTRTLWQRLIDIVGYSPAPDTVYDVALLVANELHDKRLVAVTLYKNGWYAFGFQIMANKRRA